MKTLQRIAALAACAFTGSAMAASVSVVPQQSQVTPGETVIVELFMDFTGDPTLGGGVDFAVTGPGTLAGFAPSDWFTTATDPFFSGFGTEDADADFEVHFGSFAGLDGANKVGEFTLEALAPGVIDITLAINRLYGEFFSLTGSEQTVALNGAQIEVVPVPAAAWLFVSGLGVLAARRRQRG